MFAVPCKLRQTQNADVQARLLPALHGVGVGITLRPKPPATVLHDPVPQLQLKDATLQPDAGCGGDPDCFTRRPGGSLCAQLIVQCGGVGQGEG